MKKLLLILTLLIGTASLTEAQPFKLGMKFGTNINSSDYDIKQGITTTQAGNLIKNNAGYHVGLMGRMTLLGFYIQADALYVRNSRKLNLENGSLKMKENTLSVPVVAGLNILFLRAYVGPRFDFNLGSNISKSTDNSNSIKSNIDKRWLGYQAGLGVDLFKKISIDLSYNGYFKAPSQRLSIDDTEFTIKQKNRQYWLTLGYYF